MKIDSLDPCQSITLNSFQVLVRDPQLFEEFSHESCDIVAMHDNVRFPGRKLGEYHNLKAECDSFELTSLGVISIARGHELLSLGWTKA